MTQKIVIRTFIVLFGLIAVSVVGALIFVGDGNPTEELHAAATEFGAQPSEARLRHLLNIESDGAYSYLKMALVGQAFAEQPAMFRSVAASPKTLLEQSSIDDLRRLGEQVFEYHEALKPSGFEATLRSATWLESEASGCWQRREVACLVYSESSARRARSLSFGKKLESLHPSPIPCPCPL